MTSLVAQFGGAVLVALAAGGFRGHDRALVRVTAHTFGAAAVCRVWWVPEVKSRASGGLNGKGKLRSGCPAAARDGSALLPRFARGRVALWGGGVACGCAVFWVPRHVSA
jgi:hypothetical protein